MERERERERERKRERENREKERETRVEQLRGGGREIFCVPQMYS